MKNCIYAVFADGPFKSKRFYWSAKAKKEYDDILRQDAEILNCSMKIVPEKWEKSTISMTGGCDSKTTITSTNGVYDNCAYYSYTSSESEQVDADAAHSLKNSTGCFTRSSQCKRT